MKPLIGLEAVTVAARSSRRGEIGICHTALQGKSFGEAVAYRDAGFDGLVMSGFSMNLFPHIVAH